jgi:hypothetical protein
MTTPEEIFLEAAAADSDCRLNNSPRCAARSLRRASARQLRGARHATPGTFDDVVRVGSRTRSRT